MTKIAAVCKGYRRKEKGRGVGKRGTRALFPFYVFSHPPPPFCLQLLRRPRSNHKQYHQERIILILSWYHATVSPTESKDKSNYLQRGDLEPT